MSLMNIVKNVTIIDKKTAEVKEISTDEYVSMTEEDKNNIISGLKNILAKIEQGDFVAVIGPNGAGKSTLLRLLAGILKPAQGRIAIFGQDRENFTAWDKIGYVPQNPARQHRAFPISVREVVSLGRLSGGSMFQHYTHEDKAAVDDIIERFSLKELAHRKIGELSGGQQQRVY